MYLHISNCYLTQKHHMFWDSLSRKTKTFIFYIFNIMAADNLAMQGAKASAAMVMTRFFYNIPASISKGLIMMQHPCIGNVLPIWKQSIIWTKINSVNKFVCITVPRKVLTFKEIVVNKRMGVYPRFNKIWWLCLVPTSTTRFASEVGWKKVKIW